MKPLRLSATTLGPLNGPDFCPACFWIELHFQGRFPFQIPMPGIFTTIHSYVTRLVHGRWDSDHTLPEWMAGLGAVTGYVQKLHYSWFFYEDRENQVTLTGTPDDMFALADGSYHIVDYKTARVTKTQDELFPRYEVQLNAYAYIAERLARRGPLSPISALSLIYLEPQTELGADALTELVAGGGLFLGFTSVIKGVGLRPDQMIPPLLARARTIYDLPAAPPHNEGCREAERLDQLLELLGA